MNRFENFTILISKINRNIKKIENLEMAEYNLKNVHGSCLYYLYVNKELTSSDLCEKCAEDKATISRTLLFLETNGYVTCNSKFQKRYNSPFVLTDKGFEIGKKIANKINKVLAEVDDCLTNDERIYFYRNLDKLSKGLENIVNSNELNGGIND